MPFDGGEARIRRKHMLAKLDEVRRLLDTEEKWCKKHCRTWDGRYCLFAAVMAVRAEPELYDLLLAAIQDVTGVAFKSIVRFNDQPATNHPLVLAVIEQARSRILAGKIPMSVIRRGPLYVRTRRRGLSVEA